MCNKFDTKVNNHGTTEKEKKMAQTRNSVNANVNNPYPNEHIDEKRVIRALLLRKKKKVYSITQLCQKLNQ